MEGFEGCLKYRYMEKRTMVSWPAGAAPAKSAALVFKTVVEARASEVLKQVDLTRCRRDTGEATSGMERAGDSAAATGVTTARRPGREGARKATPRRNRGLRQWRWQSKGETGGDVVIIREEGGELGGKKKRRRRGEVVRTTDRHQAWMETADKNPAKTPRPELAKFHKIKN